MKKIVRISMLVLFFTSSCKNEVSKSDKKIAFNYSKEEQRLKSLLKKIEIPSQIFVVSSKMKSQIKGKRGTIIYLNPNNLEKINGSSLGENISIELKEIINQEQLLKANTQTICDGKLLVSGGAYYINLTSDGELLKLKKDKNLEVAFPKMSNEKMSLFYGERNSTNQMNWNYANESFEKENTILKKSNLSSSKIEVDSISEIGANEIDDILAYTDNGKQKPLSKKQNKELREVNKNLQLDSKVYAIIEINKLGWINCDRFLESIEKTDLICNFISSDSIKIGQVYLVYKKINSIMNEYYYYSFQNNSMIKFSNIPIGYEAKLIAISVKNDKNYSFSSDIKIEPNKTIELKMKDTSQDDVLKLFNLMK